MLLAVVLCGCGSSAGPAGEGAPAAAIKTDQVGYLPGEAKLAMVSGSGGGGTFLVRRGGAGAVVLRGSLGTPSPDADSGDVVRVADFSALGETGEFVVEVEDLGASPPFRRLANDAR